MIMARMMLQMRALQKNDDGTDGGGDDANH